MKIAILTHPLGANYGGILQAFALSTYLKNKGHDVVVLNRQNNLPFTKRLIKLTLMAIHYPRYNNPKYQHLASFVAHYINYSKALFTDSQLANYITINNIDTVIVGSDQVWRTDFAMSYGYNYFLDFVPDNVRKLSYAASFGLDTWGYSIEQTMHIKQLLSSFAAISVREDEGVKLCKDNLEIIAEQVLDPTMLLSSEDYDAITSSRLVSGDYVFVYWLGSEEEKQKALNNSGVTGKTIIDVSLRGKEQLMSVQNWLSYIKYAEKVVTDSFHGCVFSIIFKKQFTIYSNVSGGNGRLHSLFTMLGISGLPSCKLDYTSIMEILNYKRNQSCDFIEKFLQ